MGGGLSGPLTSSTMVCHEAEKKNLVLITVQSKACRLTIRWSLYLDFIRGQFGDMKTEKKQRVVKELNLCACI